MRGEDTSDHAVGNEMVGRVVITLFSVMRWLHHPFYVFWDVDSESDIENFEFEKIDRTGHLKILELQWGLQNQNLRILRKKGS